ncbi:MAG: TetR/AcrR family transcriptional regulator C-terminal domain-containing protein [Rhodobacteraceae bacterium]|nr:TetR/AcrR family transcriptional regulator C-terminal domain-containing protein [Paracoccaceae bacterium]
MARKKDTSPRKARPPLSRDRIAEAAVALSDEAGIEALSMRKLAQRLGVEAMSLYNHVGGKDDLLSAMVDRVVGEIALPASGGDWKAEMRRRAVSAHAALMRHPWATALLVSKPNMGPAMLDYVEATLSCLVTAGFSYEAADHAWNAIDSHVYGFTLQALNFPFAPDDYADAAAEHIDMIPADRYPHLRALAERVMQRQYDGLHDFGFGLDLLLDGLESLR